MKTFILIGCSKRKWGLMGGKCPALDLYEGQLFTLAREFAVSAIKSERGPLPNIFVLSAKHGLVPSEEEIEPYEATINRAEDRDRWEFATLEQVLKMHGEEPCRIIVFAGINYRGWIPAARKIRPAWEIRVPLAGLGIGSQKKKLRDMIYRLRESSIEEALSL
jgi:hypothetical protein